MSSKENLYQQFLEWERNELSTTEANILADKLENDSFYKETYNEYSLSKQIVIQHELSNIQQTLDTFDYGKPPKLWYQKPIYWLGITGGLSMLLGVIGITYFSGENRQNKKHVATIVKKETTQPTEDITPIVPQKTSEVEVIEKEKEIVIPSKNISEHVKKEEEIIEQKEPLTIPSNNEKISNNVIVIQEENTTQLVKPIVKEEVKPCDLSIQVSTTAACLQENNGTLTIAVKNAEEPYQLLINDEEIGGNTAYDLEKGFYVVQVQDQRHCGVSQKVEVVSHLCIEKNSMIQPSQQILWELPELEENMSLKIYSLSNQLVLETTLEAGDTYEWNGQNDSGEIVPMGVYVFVLKGAEHSYSGNITLVP